VDEPKNKDEWQEAVDLAEFYLHLHSAVAYGFVKYAGQIDVARCEEILSKGAAIGITPRPDAVEANTRALVSATPQPS
jgi:hypothetical protein